MSVRIDVDGLTLFGRHGVLAGERRDGQWFDVDVTVEIREPSADRIAETVDYRDLAGCVEEIVEGEPFDLLESLAGAVADALLARFDAVLTARVRVGKPGLTVGPGGSPRVTVSRARA